MRKLLILIFAIAAGVAQAQYNVLLVPSGAGALGAATTNNVTNAVVQSGLLSNGAFTNSVRNAQTNNPGGGSSAISGYATNSGYSVVAGTASNALVVTTPYIIPYAASQNVEIVNGAWQLYAPTSTSTLYMPDLSAYGTASNGVCIRIDCIPGATSLTIATNNQVVQAPGFFVTNGVQGTRVFFDKNPGTNTSATLWSLNKDYDIPIQSVVVTPYVISFAASQNVSIANGAWQLYAPTSTTTLYMPDLTSYGATSNMVSIRIDCIPEANSFTIATNNQVVLATDFSVTNSVRGTRVFFDKDPGTNTSATLWSLNP